MSLQQSLAEFRFNLETLDLMTDMGRNSKEAVLMLSQLGFNQSLVNFMLSQRSLLNMVLLRLQLYSEQNMTEQKVRAGLSTLNNSSVNHLLDYLFPSTKKQSPLSTPKNEPELEKKSVQTQETQEEHDNQEEQEEQEEQKNTEGEGEGEEEDELPFDVFFHERITKSNDPTHVVKLNEVYNAFTKWWNEHYEDEVSTKDELKEYLSEKLGQKIKSTVSYISLN